MGKPKVSKMVGNCLCSCKKALRTTNAGDNYNLMPTKIGRLDYSSYWSLNSQVTIRKSSESQDPYGGGQPAPTRTGFNTFMWPNDIELHNIINYITKIPGQAGAPDRYTLGNQGYKVHWKNLLESVTGVNTWHEGTNVSNNDFRNVLDQLIITNGDGTQYLFIPVYSETPFKNVTEPAETVKIGKYFPQSQSLELAFPELYAQFQAEVRAVGQEHGDIEAWIESIMGPKTVPRYCLVGDDFVTTVLCGWDWYQGPGDCGPGTFSWWLTWTLGKSQYPPRPMDNWVQGNFSNSNTIGVIANPPVPNAPYGCPVSVPFGFLTVNGWAGQQPRFLYYVYEMLLNQEVDYSTFAYAEVDTPPDVAAYGYLLPLSGAEIDSATFRSIPKVKISKHATQHIVTVTDDRDTKWIAGINWLCSSPPFPILGLFPGMVYNTTDGQGNNITKTICDLDRSNYKLTGGQVTDLDSLYVEKYQALQQTVGDVILNDGDDTYPSVYTNFPCGIDKADGGVTGGSFFVYTYSIENAEFFDDTITQITDDGQILFTPHKIQQEVIRHENNYDVIRSAVGIYDNRVIFDIEANFDASDSFDLASGTNDFGIASGHTYGPYHGEYSTFDFSESDEWTLGTTWTGWKERVPYKTPMVGPMIRYSQTYLVDQSSVNNPLGCRVTMPENPLLNVCTPRAGAPNNDLHGWKNEGIGLYCPFNKTMCGGYIDITNIEEGREPDNLVFYDLNMLETRVGDIPSLKLLTPGTIQFDIRDFMLPNNPDVYNFSGIAGTVCGDGTIKNTVAIGTMVQGDLNVSGIVTDVVQAQGDSTLYNLFSTSEQFTQNLQSVIRDYNPSYFSSSSGLLYDDKHFLGFDYLKKSNVNYGYVNASSSPGTVPFYILDSASELIGYYSRDFYGVESTKCNDSNYWIENVRGFEINNIWFDDVYVLKPDLGYKRFTQVQTNNDTLLWQSLDNVIEVEKQDGITINDNANNVNIKVNWTFAISIVDDEVVPQLEIECVHNNKIYDCVNTSLCDMSQNGFKFLVDYPTVGITDGDYLEQFILKQSNINVSGGIFLAQKEITVQPLAFGFTNHVPSITGNTFTVGQGD